MEGQEVSHKHHLDSNFFKSIFISLGEFFHIKVFFALCAWGFSWIFDGNYQILISIYILILLDTSTGLCVAYKKNELSSRGFYRVAIKCLIYFIMIIIGRLVDKHVPISFAAPIMDSFLVITEAISILENLGMLGFPVPNKLMERFAKLKNEK